MSKYYKKFLFSLIFLFLGIQVSYTNIVYITNTDGTMDGHVYSGASSGSDTTATTIRVGQGTAAQNYYYHGFIGINVSSVANQNITSATLVITYNSFLGTQGRIGSALRLDNIDFGNSIETADFYGSTTNQLDIATNISTTGTAGSVRMIDVSKAVSNDANTAKGWSKNGSSYWSEFRLRPFSFETPPGGSAYQNVASDENVTYAAASLIIHYTPKPFSLTKNTDVPARTINTNYTNVTVLAFKVKDTAIGHKLSKIMVANSGTMTTNDVAQVKLWHDVDGNFQYTAGGDGTTPAAILNWDNAQYWTNNGLSLNIDGADTNYLLTIDTTSHAYQGASFIGAIPVDGIENSVGEKVGSIENNNAITITNSTSITQGTIVINEYQTRSSDPVQDRIELYNKTGAYVDLNGYQLVDISGTVNKTFGAGDIIGPYSYFIADGFTGFNNSSDLIVLRNTTSMTIDRIDYASAPNDNTSDQRKPNGRWSGLNVSTDFSNDLKPTWGGNNDEYVGDLSLDEGAYFTTNATSSVRLYDPDMAGQGSKNINIKSTSDGTGITLALTESNSSGIFKGSFGFTSGSSGGGKIQVSDNDTVTATYVDATSPNYPVTTTALWKQTATPGDVAGDIVINEFQTDSSGNVSDAFELFNRTSSNINLNGWTIYDGILDHSYDLTPHGTLNSSNYLYISGQSGWNNSDTIYLKNNLGVIIDRITYADYDPAPQSSYGRKPNGQFSGLDVWTDFTNYPVPTWNANNDLNPGQLSLDKAVYFTTNTAAIVTLRDNDIAGKGQTNIQVYSGVDPAGFSLILYESASGSFTNRFSFSTNTTSGNRIRVTNLDTVYVRYIDKEPPNYTNINTAVWKFNPDPGDSPGDVVINEFQTRSSDPLEDAIELFNRTASSIDLTGWVLKDIGGNIGYTFTETITASNYLLLSGLSSEWNNSDDAIVLVNGSGVIIDKIGYSSAPADNTSFARKPNGTWSGTNKVVDFQVDTTPTFGWNNDSTANMGQVSSDKLFYFTTSATCYVTLLDGDNPVGPIPVIITNSTLGSTNWFTLNLAGTSGTYTNFFRFSETALNTNSKIMYVTNRNSIKLIYTDADPPGIQDSYTIQWFKNTPPNIKISEVDSRGRWAGDTQKEFVELYNVTGSAVNLTNWQIVNDGGSILVTLTGTIPAYGFYLCGATSITDISGFSPDNTWSIGYKLTDTDFGIRLVSSDGAYVDAVGWGASAGIDNGYYEGTPLAGVGTSEYVTFERKATAGSTPVSLARPAGSEWDDGHAYDTDNNSSDFVRQPAMNPQGSKSAQEPPAHSVTLTKNADFTSTNYRGETNIVVLAFNFNDPLDTIIKKVTVQNLGTAATSEISNMKLWKDNDSSSTITGGDILVTGLYYNGSTYWTNNNITQSSGSTNTNGNYLISVDLFSDPNFGRTVIAAVPAGGVACSLGVGNTVPVINNGFSLIDTRAPVIGSKLNLSPTVVSNNASQQFSLWAFITNKGDGVTASVYWYGHETDTNNYPVYSLAFSGGSLYSNSTATIPKSVKPTNYILILKASDYKGYRSDYTNTLPLVLTVTGAFPPVVRSFTSDRSLVSLNGDANQRTVNFTTIAEDQDTALTNLTAILSNLNLLGGTTSVTAMNYTGSGKWQYSHTVPQGTAPGTYSIITVVTDDLGYYNTGSLDITLRSNREPVANAGEDLTARGGEKVQLDGSKSADPDNDALFYLWEVVSSSEMITIENPSAVRPVFTAPDVTIDVIVKLTVTDLGGFSSTDNVTVQINKSFPPDLSDAHPYNTIIRSGNNELKFVNCSEGTVIKIYTVTGNKVAEIPDQNDSTVTWTIPDKTAAGVYIAFLKDKSGNTKKVKFIIVR